MVKLTYAPSGTTSLIRDGIAQGQDDFLNEDESRYELERWMKKQSCAASSRGQGAQLLQEEVSTGGVCSGSSNEGHQGGQLQSSHPPDSARGYGSRLLRWSQKGSSRSHSHHLHSCWRIPGIDYKDFEFKGEMMPNASCFDNWCQTCKKASEVTQ